MNRLSVSPIGKKPFLRCQTEAQPRIDSTAAGIAALSDSGNGWGWAAGASVEAVVLDNFSVKAEYLHVELGNETLFAGPANEFDATANAHVAQIG